MNPLSQKLIDITAQFSVLSPFQAEVNSIFQHLENPKLRIAVFAPFNHGKSTLLNAILGDRTLPINLIPTTGTAITIKYSKSISTRIQLRGGDEVARNGTDILQKYAVLDGDRCMREDVESIEVTCPHPLLAKGVELVDLPGTNDMEAQDQLVFNEILKTDLVISILDARKLLCMGELKGLEEWLLHRGIKTAIFVVNFTNLIDENEDRKALVERARFIAREFRGNLPNNIKNLFRVDALPALRAKIKSDNNLAVQSGILAFENALHNIVDLLLPQLEEVRMPRVYAIGDRLKQSLEKELQTLKNEMSVIDRDRNHEIERGRQEAKQMQAIFETSLQNVKNWLSTEGFIERYHELCLQALLNDSLFDFLDSCLRDTLVEYVETCDRIVEEACEKFGTNSPDEIEIFLPDFPDLNLPEEPIYPTEGEGAGSAAFWGGVAGFFVGGPWGAVAGAGGAAAIANNSVKQRREQLQAEYYAHVRTICNNTVKNYLTTFSENVLDAISKYENSVTVFSYTPPTEASKTRDKRNNLSKIQSGLMEINHLISQ